MTLHNLLGFSTGEAALHNLHVHVHVLACTGKCHTTQPTGVQQWLMPTLHNLLGFSTGEPRYSLYNLLGFSTDLHNLLGFSTDKALPHNLLGFSTDKALLHNLLGFSTDYYITCWG